MSWKINKDGLVEHYINSYIKEILKEYKRRELLILKARGRGGGIQSQINNLISKAMKEETFLDRLIKEEEELGTKIIALGKAVNTDGFASRVGSYQFELLNTQLNVMQAYRRILNLRIQDLKSKQ